MKVRSWGKQMEYIYIYIHTLRSYQVGKMDKSDGIMGKALK